MLYYNFGVLLSSAPPKAIVFSLYKKTNISCVGHHLFKFDASTFTTNPIWAKISAETTCLMIGIIYGRGATELYVLGG